MRNLYPRRNAKRDSLMELRWRHLDHVDHMARSGEPLDKIQADLSAPWFSERFFGPLRSRRRDRVPSDAVRRLIMSWQLVDLVEERRAELAAMPKPSPEQLQAALDAADNDYQRAVIRAYPEQLVANQ